MGAKPRWYNCATTPDGYLKYKVRFMYVRKSWIEDQVICYSEKVVDHIHKTEAAKLFTILAIVPERLQATIENSWDKRRLTT